MMGPGSRLPVNPPTPSHDVAGPRSTGARNRRGGGAGGAALPAAMALTTLLLLLPRGLSAQGEPNRPVLHGRHWVATTGTPLGSEAGAKMFREGGNPVDAACAMLAATSTMWDVVGWGGETQALIYNPNTGEVIGINGAGVAPTGATVERYREEEGLDYPPSYGPLAAITPGNPGALMTMLAEYGTMSLAEVLAPSIQMAEEGYAMDASTARRIQRSKEWISRWTYSKEVYWTHPEDEEHPGPYAGEIFRQPELARTLEKLVEAERRALEDGATRKEAIYAAYDRFYEGDIAEEIVRGFQEEGGLITEEDLANWEVKIEEPVHTDYEGYDVYKLTTWTQGPVMLQALNILENFDLKAMGYNSARYVHTLYQAMNLAYADRDFYYGDPYVSPEEPIEGLLSKAYARDRAEAIDPSGENDPTIEPGNPYEYQEGSNPYLDLLERWPESFTENDADGGDGEDDASARSTQSNLASLASEADLEGALSPGEREFFASFNRGTTAIQAADTTGWVVSITPSGAWPPAVVAGNTGIGMSQRAQQFVTERGQNPYNVIEPGKRPRVTLTPSMVLEDGEPYLSFSIQGGDTQDQNSLQFFLNSVVFGMGPQEAAEAANFTSYQMWGSFSHEKDPGLVRLNDEMPAWVRKDLEDRGYEMRFSGRTSGPMNAIWFDREHGTFWGAASDYGNDYGIAW